MAMPEAVRERMVHGSTTSQPAMAEYKSSKFGGPEFTKSFVVHPFNREEEAVTIHGCCDAGHAKTVFCYEVHNGIDPSSVTLVTKRLLEQICEPVSQEAEEQPIGDVSGKPTSKTRPNR